MGKRFEKIMAAVYGAKPLRPEDLRGTDLAALDILRLLRKRGVVILEFRSEPEVLGKFAAAGGVALKQYETVRLDSPHLTRLETVAQTDGISSAVIARHTLPHIDLYQHPREYRGHQIGNLLDSETWPHAAVLGYERSVEERSVSFYDLRAAALKLADDDERYVELLTKPLFTIDGKYRAEDFDIGEPPTFPVLSWDRKVGARFHVGGSVTTHHPEANTALERFRDEMVNSKELTMRVQPDLLFLVWQPRVAHRGVRTVGRPGLTVLTRETWHFGGTR